MTNCLFDGTRYLGCGYKGIDAYIGLITRDRYLALYIASAGMTGNGKRRNPDRRQAFVHLTAKLADVNRRTVKLYVQAARCGKMSCGFTGISKPFDALGKEKLEEQFRRGGNFRFDFWLSSAEPDDFVDELELACCLGLNAVSKRSQPYPDPTKWAAPTFTRGEDQ